MGNAKLWRYPLLGRMLDALGAVPIYRREEHDGEVDNQTAFDRLLGVLAAGHCMGIFPEGISHAESQLVRLKTGTARIALMVSAKRETPVSIVPCGLTYVHRHRFRSQALLHFGAPIVIEDPWIARYVEDEQAAVSELTDHLGAELGRVTLNAPDWDTLRFIHAARRLYKPKEAHLSPQTYVELSRRFVDRYLAVADQPAIRKLRSEVEDYQAQLDLFGLKDHHVSHPMELALAVRRVAWRALMAVVLLPLAVPGALIHLPVAWAAAAAGTRFSYDLDDQATVKVITAILLLPLIYTGIVVTVWLNFGPLWGLVTVAGLPLSFYATLKVLEKQTQLMLSTLNILRLARLHQEVKELHATRERLVNAIRETVDRYADPELPRMFSGSDFEGSRR